MLGRSLTLALVGLSVLTQALPIESETKAAVSARQDTFTLGGSLPSDATTAIAELEITLEQLQNLAHRTHAEWEEIGAIKALLFYVYGITSISAPDGTTTTLTISSRQNTFTLGGSPPDGTTSTLTIGSRQNTFTLGGSLPSDEATAIAELQVDLEQLQDLPYKTLEDWELIGAIQALLFYKYGITSEYAPPGTTTTLTPGKRSQSFTLGGSLPASSTQAIAELEVDLEALQDLSTKTYADWELIGAIKALLYYTYHITSISAPPGTTTTLTVGKRASFTLGGSLPSSKTEAIAELEATLEQLQDLSVKTTADWELIGAIKALLYYTYHITSISAPSGTISTLTVGKRQDYTELIGSVPSGWTEAIEYLEVKLEYLQNLPEKTWQDWEAIAAIKELLYYTYGITSITAPDGTTTTFTIGKRQDYTELIGSVPSGWTEAIEYLEIKLEYLQDLPNKTWEDWQAIVAIKELLYYTYGITSITAPDGTTTTLTIG